MMDAILLLKTVAICSVVYAVTWAWRVWWLRPKKLEKILRDQGFKGNSYKLFFGDQKETSMLIKEALSKPIEITDDIAPRVLPHVVKTINTYGKNSFMWVGRIPRLNITEPALVKEVLATYQKFHKNHHSLDPITLLFLCGLVSLEGEKWTKHKKLLSPAFHMERLKYSVPALYSSAMGVVDKWEKIVSKRGGTAEVDVWPDLLNLTSTVISKTLFGDSYEEGRDVLQHMINELADLAIQVVNYPVYIPGQSKFFPDKTQKKMKEIDRKIKGSLREIINKRLKEMKAGEAPIDDLLGVMLETNIKAIEENRSNKSVGMSIEDIIEECKIFYFAGQDTTSTLLLWTMFFMSRYPKWQERAREEVTQEFGNKKPDFEGINRLKVVKMILNEVLRIYPPIVELTKETIEETKLGPYTLPAGVQLMVPQVLVHQDPELWGEDAKSFNPERFSEGVSEASKSPGAYFPFGWGPRMCIGTNLALLEAKFGITVILQHFSIDLSPSYVHAPRTVINLQPQYGAPMILRKL